MPGSWLERRASTRTRSLDLAIEAAGGMYVVPVDADPTAVRDQVQQRGIRALEVHTPDHGWLAGLAIEHLSVVRAQPAAANLNSLSHLQSLTLNTLWTGTLDLAGLPDLRWLEVGEIQSGQFEQLTATGHPGLTSLTVTPFRGRDLDGLAAFPALAHVDLSHSRSLVDLGGLAGPDDVTSVSLEACSKVASLAGLAAVTGLRVVGLATMTKVADVDPLAELTGLEALSFERIRGDEVSLAPLRDHPGLRLLWVNGVRWSHDQVVGLLDNPVLELLGASHRGTWVRVDGEMVQVFDNALQAYDDTVTPGPQAQRRLAELQAEGNALMDP